MKACQLLCAIAASVCTQAQILDFSPQFTMWPSGPTVVKLDTIIGGSSAPNAHGLALDVASHTILLNFAWGEAYGLEDLRAPFAQASLETAGSVYKSNGVVYDLTPRVHQQSATCGGLFSVDLSLADLGSYTVTQQEEDILNGRWFINIQSSSGSSPEIRGQLAPVPEPSEYAACVAIGLLAFGLHQRRRYAARAFNP